jgi:hypothetical protein
MKILSLLFVFLLILSSCGNEDKNSLTTRIKDVTENEFQKRSVELDRLIIDSLNIESVNLRDFYTDRINNFSAYLARSEDANQRYIKELIDKGDTAKASKVKARHLENLELASMLDSLHYSADSSIKVWRAVYLLNAKFGASSLSEKTTKYFYQKDTTEVVIQVADPILHDIVNGNDYLTLLTVGQALKKGL